MLDQRAPRKIGAKPAGIPSENKEFTYLLTYLQPQVRDWSLFMASGGLKEVKGGSEFFSGLTRGASRKC